MAKRHRASLRQHNGNRYEILVIQLDIIDSAKALVKGDYYKLFPDERIIRRRIADLIETHFRACSNVYEQLIQFEEAITVALYHAGYDSEPRESGKVFRIRS